MLPRALTQPISPSNFSESTIPKSTRVIGWFWDDGINVRLGDEMNGYLAEENVQSVSEIGPWLQEAIAHFYPNSSYAVSLDQAVKERAAQRVFVPPKIGASVRCPHCGAPHASQMDELIAFVCLHCGTSVIVEPPKVSSLDQVFLKMPAGVCQCLRR